jgi:hypothetical protein
MKHLKKFNESLQSDEVDELKEFCETSLAYLLDDGYNVSLSIRDQVKYPGVNHIVVSLGLPKENYVALRPYDGYRNFFWDDVKDYYIPFIQMLQRRYELLAYLDDSAYVYLQFNTISGFRYLSLDAVINDRTGLDYPLWGINLKVVDKI